jgi:vacuolar iron transporter family protein
MRRLHTHGDSHFVTRIGWMRAAVLGANDGIISTSSLIVGVASAGATKSAIILAGAAGLVGGAMSMAVGEYVSVSSQADTESADLAREAKQLLTRPHFEHDELASIYVGRGVDPELARQVAAQLMVKDALGAHARDELGISKVSTARPVQAAMTSAPTFAVGALLPLLVVWLIPTQMLVPAVFISSLFFLGVLGAIGARMGGAAMLKPVARVMFWGAIALAVTAGVGAVFGTVT